MRLPEDQSGSAALRAILDREKAGNTQIGETVTIPHARVEGLARIQAALAITANGPIQICCLFVSPASDQRGHLTFLAQLAAFFREENNVKELLRSRNPEQIHAYLTRTVLLGG